MTGVPILPVVTVTISGEIDIATSQAMRDTLAIAPRPAPLEVNMSAVTFMDASETGVRGGAAAAASAAGAAHRADTQPGGAEADRGPGTGRDSHPVISGPRQPVQVPMLRKMAGQSWASSGRLGLGSDP